MFLYAGIDAKEISRELYWQDQNILYFHSFTNVDKQAMFHVKILPMQKQNINQYCNFFPCVF